MAEMLIQSESLTSIADKIRVLSGTTEAMGLDAMENHVNEANTNVVTEAELIAQIVSALEGKVGGSSGDGTSIETCTVTIDNVEDIAYIGIDNNGNTIYCQSINNNGNTLSVNVVKGTIFFVVYYYTILVHNHTSGIEEGIAPMNNIHTYYLKSDATNTEVITIMTD